MMIAVSSRVVVIQSHVYPGKSITVVILLTWAQTNLQWEQTYGNTDLML
jgi:hypothetical protein